MKYINIRVKKIGFFKILSQIIARIAYILRNKKLDNRLYGEFFCERKILKPIDQCCLPIKTCSKYSSPSTLKWIEDLKPDILLCHTGEWVPRKVRSISGVKHVIGGHPGLTHLYRGVHSPFWAIYNNDISSIGWTAFLLDSGVDDGDIIEQGRIKFDVAKTFTFTSLSWIGMKEIAKSHVRIVNRLTSLGKLEAAKNTNITDRTLYDLPGVIELILLAKAEYIQMVAGGHTSKITKFGQLLLKYVTVIFLPKVCVVCVGMLSL